jgi:hypothetical protein
MPKSFNACVYCLTVLPTLRPPDQGIINAANLHYESLLLLPTLQCARMQTHSGGYPDVQCRYICGLLAKRSAGAVPQDEFDSDSDVVMTKWLTPVSKTKCPGGNGQFIRVSKNDATAVAEVTGDDTAANLTVKKREIWQRRDTRRRR